MRRELVSVVVLGLTSACAATGRGGGAAALSEDERTRTFDAREDEILRDLAAVDSRIARRARMTPSEDDLRRVTMAAVLREDRAVVIVDGAIDPFSFDARARGLDSARQKILALPPMRGGPRTSERELLVRLVDAEQMRLEEERALPRSASSLVRAIVDGWNPPKSEREAADVDRWLARRLDELREAIQSANDPATSLDVVRARELDDALDALERIASAPGYTAAMQALVRVREALEAAASKPAAKAQSDWRSIARRARVHLGETDSPETLGKDLEIAEADLLARATSAIAESGASKDAIAENLERRVFVSGACIDAVPGSRVPSMAAPPERESSCHLRHMVANVDGAAANALALAVMHDHVVIALWALDVARGDATIAEAEGRHPLLVPVLPDTRARYERIALARPVAAIGAGETVRILMLGDAKDDMRARAQAWSSIGDVPLDIAQRDLGAKRLKSE